MLPPDMYSGNEKTRFGAGKNTQTNNDGNFNKYLQSCIRIQNSLTKECKAENIPQDFKITRDKIQAWRSRTCPNEQKNIIVPDIPTGFKRRVERVKNKTMHPRVGYVFLLIKCLP